MYYYPKADSHIKEKLKVVLDLSNYATKKELELKVLNKGIDTSDLFAEKYFIALKVEVDRPDVNKLVNVLNSLKNSTLKGLGFLRVVVSAGEGVSFKFDSLSSYFKKN